MDRKTEERVMEAEWTCPGIAGRQSSIADPKTGRPALIGGRKCGAKVKMRYFDQFVTEVSGRLLCRDCAAEFAPMHDQEMAEGMAREMGISTSEMLQIRKWKEDTKNEIDKSCDQEIDVMDGEKSNKLMSGRQSYPVSGPAKCSNPFDQNRPLLSKIRENLASVPSPTIQVSPTGG